MSSHSHRTEYKRVVTQMSEEMLARWILKNLDWSGGNDDANGAFLTSILLEHRRQASGGPDRDGVLEEAAKAVPLHPVFEQALAAVRPPSEAGPGSGK